MPYKISGKGREKMEKNLIGKVFLADHVCTYNSNFIAGFFAVVVVNYRELFATEIISSFMYSVDEPIVALGPSLQIFCGIIIALILLPLRKVFFEEKQDLKKLGLIIIGLSLLSTIGPTMGSFEGYIYTKIPYMLSGFGVF
jgi:hypothetical protein